MNNLTNADTNYNESSAIDLALENFFNNILECIIIEN